MKPFAYERAADAGAAVAARRDLPGRRHQPRRPDEARRGDAGRAGRRLAAGRLDRAGGRRGAHRRGGAQRRRRARRARPATCCAEALLAGASPQLRNVATVGGNLLQRTRCPYFQDVTKPCNKREPQARAARRVEGHHRDLAVLGHSRGVRRHPSGRHERRAGRARRHRPHRPARHRRARPAPAAGRRARARHGARGRRADHRDHRPGRRPGTHRYRKVRDRASYAFALVSIASVVDGREARIALGSVAPVPWRCERAEAVFARDGRRAPRPPTPSSSRRARCATTPSR